MDQKQAKQSVWKQIQTYILNNSSKHIHKLNNDDIRHTINEIQGGEEEFGNTIGHFLPSHRYIDFTLFSDAWDKRIQYRKKLQDSISQPK